MSIELYFLRSSEQKIVTDMVYYSQRVDETDKRVSDFENLNIYSDFYGLTAKDLGLYAMKEHQMCGAIWTRRLNIEHNSNGFLDEDTPVLNIAVKPEFRNSGIATTMIDQFLIEAGALYSAISVNVSNKQESITFFKKFGFEVVADEKRETYAQNEDALIMVKKLDKKEIVRPTDGYDPTRWMD
ncbi:MAG: GNAT family N-acetyltransferase [Campylobacterota bacterium]|nr:GNAT family N-acetyltransferase [Campylobacterota bacterium]